MYFVIDDGFSRSAIARQEGGEIIEALEFDEKGQPVWDGPDAGLCDHRGVGGHQGYALLDVALRAAEANAYLHTNGIKHLPREEVTT